MGSARDVVRARVDAFNKRMLYRRPRCITTTPSTLAAERRPA